MNTTQLPTEVQSAISDSIEQSFNAAMRFHKEKGDSKMALLIAKQCCRAMLIGTKKLPGDLINRIVDSIEIDFVNQKLTGNFEVGAK